MFQDIKVQYVAAGRAIYNKGEYGHNIYFLLKGEAAILKVVDKDK